MWYGLNVFLKYVKSVVWKLKCEGTFGGQCIKNKSFTFPTSCEARAGRTRERLLRKDISLRDTCDPLLAAVNRRSSVDCTADMFPVNAIAFRSPNDNPPYLSCEKCTDINICNEVFFLAICNVLMLSLFISCIVYVESDSTVYLTIMYI